MNESKNNQQVHHVFFRGDGRTLFYIYLLTSVAILVVAVFAEPLLSVYFNIGQPSISMGLAILTSILIFAFSYALLKSSLFNFYYNRIRVGNHATKFTGTFGELFLGMVKTAVFLSIAYLVYYYLLPRISPPYVSLAIHAILLLIVFLFFQYVYFSSRRYRFSRVMMQRYRILLNGNLLKLSARSFLNGVVSIITLGLYLPIFYHRRFSMIYNNLYYGNVPFSYDGDDREFLKIALDGFFLTVFTFGVYYFWWKPQLYNYYIQHIRVGDARFHCDIQPKEYFDLIFTNLVLIVFSFGFASPWAKVRMARFFIDSTTLVGPWPGQKAAKQKATGKARPETEAAADYLGLGGIGIF
jgi:uncharacterized membrane protein YjgN (DUF898 family)